MKLCWIEANVSEVQETGNSVIMSRVKAKEELQYEVPALQRYLVASDVAPE